LPQIDSLLGTNNDPNDKFPNLESLTNIKNVETKANAKLSSTRCTNSSDTDESESQNKTWLASSISTSQNEQTKDKKETQTENANEKVSYLLT